MPWARLDDSFWRNEKIKGVSNDALAVHILAISYSAGELTDGVIDAEALHILSYKRHAQEQTVAGELVKAGLWHERGDGAYQIHDFLDYNPRREDVLKQRAQNKARQDTWRERHGTNADGNAEHNAISNGVSKSVPYPVPVPYPDPIPGPVETIAVADAPAKQEDSLKPSKKAPAHAEQYEALALEENGSLKGVPKTKRDIWNKHAKECDDAGWSGEDIHTIATRWRKQYPDYPFTSAVCVRNGCRMLQMGEPRASPPTNGHAREPVRDASYYAADPYMQRLRGNAAAEARERLEAREKVGNDA